MKYRAHNAARDGNEKEIVDCLRANGLSVKRLNKPLDLLVGYGGFTVLAEVKMPRNKRGDPKPYTDDQEEFLETWAGGHVLLINIDDAKQLAKRMKNISIAMRNFSENSLELQEKDLVNQGDSASKNKRPDGAFDTPAKPSNNESEFAK